MTATFRTAPKYIIPLITLTSDEGRELQFLSMHFFYLLRPSYLIKIFCSASYSATLPFLSYYGDRPCFTPICKNQLIQTAWGVIFSRCKLLATHLKWQRCLFGCLGTQAILRLSSSDLESAHCLYEAPHTTQHRLTALPRGANWSFTHHASLERLLLTTCSTCCYQCRVWPLYTSCLKARFIPLLGCTKHIWTERKSPKSSHGV